jgi:hypothetical protein
MQICKQVLQVLRVQFLAVSGHLVAAEADDIRHSLVIRGQSAQRKILALKNPFKSGTLPAARGVWLMTARTLGIIYFSASGFLRAQPKFRIRLSPLDLACGSRDERNDR